MSNWKTAALAATAACAWSAVPAHAATTLSTGSGDGSVTVSVLNAGGFGSATSGYGGSNALFDPIGANPRGGTTYQSSIFLGINGGTREDITLADAAVTGTTANSVSSSFTFAGLRFALVQDLARLIDNGAQSGSVLTQAYTITNTGAEAVSFDLVRYLDGDLSFEGGQGRNDDGGGRYIAADGTEILFETDRALGTAQSDTFVGIATTGGTNTGFDVIDFSSNLERIAQGRNQTNTVLGDSGDADQFIDAGAGYDTSLAQGRAFALAAGASTSFTTRTFFGTGAPERVVVPPPAGAVPEPATWAMLLLGFGAVGAAARTRRRAVRFA